MHSKLCPGIPEISLGHLVIIENKPIGAMFISTHNFPKQPKFTVACWLARLPVNPEIAGIPFQAHACMAYSL